MSFTQIPDLLIDSKKLSVYELAVAVFIARKTMGWGKRTDGISYTQFTDSLGIAKNTVIKAINSLIDKKIIAKQMTVKANGGQSFNLYWFTDEFVDEANKDRLPMSTPLVHDMNRGSSPDEQGAVHDMNRGSSPDEQGAVHDMNTQDKPNTKQTRQDKPNTKEPAADAGEQRKKEGDAGVPDDLHFDKRVNLQAEWMEKEVMHDTFRGICEIYEVKPMQRHWEFVSEAFVDYWSANASSADRFKKKDWVLTFKNHCRKKLEECGWKWRKEQSVKSRNPNNTKHEAQKGEWHVESI